MTRPIVALIGCGRAKLSRGAPARDIYTGALFKKARAWAERNASEWAILSALHGMVRHDQLLLPYDYRLPARQGQRLGWEKDIMRQVLGR